MFGFLIDRISSLFNFTSSVLYFTVKSSISVFIVFLISVFLTWLVRGWLLVSGVDWKFSTNFVFQPCVQVGVCSYPWAIIDLHRPYSPSTSVLTPELEYSAALRFRISDSESNRLAGMFLVKFALENGNGHVLSSCVTSTIMPYRSTLIRIARKLIFWPLMILDYFEEYHSINVLCPNPLSFTYDNPALRLRVEIQNVGVQLVNDGGVELSGHLRGLQYYLYWWPIVSSSALFFIIFWCSTTISCGFWLFQIARKPIEQEKMPSPPTSPTFWKEKRTSSPIRSPSLPFSDDDDFRFASNRVDDQHRFTPQTRRRGGWERENDENDENGHCFQRRLSSRMQRALLDLDDSNLGVS